VTTTDFRLDLDDAGRRTLAELLRQGLPGAPALRISGLEELTGGWETYLLAATAETIGKGASERFGWVLRFRIGAQANDFALQEYAVMKSVAERGIPVPGRLQLVTGDSPFGAPFLAMEKVEGATLGRLLETEPSAVVGELLNSMVELFVALHSLRPDTDWFADPSRLDRAAPGTTVPGVMGRIQDTIERHQLETMAPLTDWLRSRLADVPPGEISLVHNDFHPDNIIVRRQGAMCVLDWSFAGPGDPRLDLAWTVFLMGTAVGHQHRQSVLTRYRRLSGATIDPFLVLEALKLADRLVTLASWLEEPAVIPVAKITPQAMRTDYRIHILNIYRRLKELTGLSLPLFEEL
jgi:aminoglycoside phosphotransferase (APT) family kinase protein